MNIVRLLMNNSKFINYSVLSILNEVKISTIGLSNNMGAYPIIEYIFNSLFLKITGLLEQKLKTIIFELGSNNIDIRYDILNGEFKTYSLDFNKNKILKELIKQTVIFSTNKKYTINYVNLWKNSVENINKIFDKSIFTNCNPRKYLEYNILSKKNILPSLYSYDCKINNGNISFELPNQLHKIYNHANNTRNRLAHNLLSSYDNYPKFNDFGTEEFNYTNYFLFYSAYNMLDMLLIDLYASYTIYIK